MKKNLLLLLFILACGYANAQDNIVKKNGDEIKAKVVEIGTEEIKYKRFENLSGPTYVINKNDVFMIKYENGSKDVISAPAQETKTEAAPKQETVSKAPQAAVPAKKYGYIEKVREVQSKDPSFSFYAGNGWLLGPGVLNPVVGMDLRMSRKNVFLRGLSVGVRASFRNLDDPNWQHSTIIMGGGFTVKYHAPLPIKVVQPYVVAHLGIASFERYDIDLVPNGSGGDMWVGPGYSQSILPYGGFGVGSNFMVAKRFGFFTELGYFTTSLINTGIVVKLF